MKTVPPPLPILEVMGPCLTVYTNGSRAKRKVRRAQCGDRKKFLLALTLRLLLEAAAKINELYPLIAASVPHLTLFGILVFH